MAKTDIECNNQYVRRNNNWICPKCKDISLPFHDSSQPLNQKSSLNSSSRTRSKETSGPNVNDKFKSLMTEINEFIDDSLVINEDEPEFQLNSTSCKYLQLQDYNTLSRNTNCSFSTFHLNIASLAKHFDELSTLLSLITHKFSFIGISETRFLKDHKPTFDFSIPGYRAIHTPTESTAGGVLLYVLDSLAFKPRPDLSQLMYQSKNLESVFVEIVLPKKLT